MVTRFRTLTISIYHRRGGRLGFLPTSSDLVSIPQSTSAGLQEIGAVASLAVLSEHFDPARRHPNVLRASRENRTSR